MTADIDHPSDCCGRSDDCQWCFDKMCGITVRLYRPLAALEAHIESCKVHFLTSRGVPRAGVYRLPL